MTTESAALRHLIRLCKSAGATAMRVHDGEAWACERTNNENVLHKASASTGEDLLVCWGADGEKLAAWSLVWGNAPDELVSDYSGNAWADIVWDKWQAEVGA